MAAIHGFAERGRSLSRRARLTSVVITVPMASSRTRAASLGCTSSTPSPAATSCCAVLEWISKWRAENDANGEASPET